MLLHAVIAKKSILNQNQKIQSHAAVVTVDLSVAGHKMVPRRVLVRPLNFAANKSPKILHRDQE